MAGLVISLPAGERLLRVTIRGGAIRRLDHCAAAEPVEQLPGGLTHPEGQPVGFLALGLTRSGQLHLGPPGSTLIDVFRSSPS